jgi:hypothetical protein
MNTSREGNMIRILSRGPSAIALGMLVSTIAGISVALAQTSVQAVFEKHGLLGTFAMDCTKAASRANFYFVNRLMDADHVQRDQMSGPTTRDAVIIIDKISEVKSNEVAWSGTRDGKPQDGVWRIERKGDSMRAQGIEATWDGKKQISGGKWANGGGEVPWLNKCGG